MSAEEPWYKEFNSEFWILISGSILGFMGLMLQAILKSRCKECSCLGFKCVRDVAPPGQEPTIDLSVLERGRAGSNPPAPVDSPTK